MERVTDSAIDITELENKIKAEFENYLISRGFSTEGNAVSKIPTNIFNASFRNVYKRIFRAHNIYTCDSDLIDKLSDIYADIVAEYNIASRVEMFANMIGIEDDTIKYWASGNNRNTVYIDKRSKQVVDGAHLSMYLVKHPEDLEELEVSTPHILTAKKILALSQRTIIAKSLDFQNGLLMDLNNGLETGTEYNKKRATETVQAQAVLTTQDLPKLNCL